MQPAVANQETRSSSHLLKGLLVVATLIGVGLVGWWMLQPTAEEQFEQALAAYDKGDWKTLRHIASEVEGHLDLESKAGLLDGMLAMHEGRLQGAVAVLETARNDSATSARAWLLTGEAFFKTRQLDQARRALEQAVAVDPVSVQAHRLLGATLYDLGAMPLAIEHLEKTAELAPNDPRPHRLIGLIYKDYERYEEAVAAYLESLSRSPKRALAAEVRLELAESLIAQREYAAAMDVLQMAPSHPEVWVKLAQCHDALGDREQAIVLLQQVLREMPDHGEALLMKATMAMEGGHFEESRSLLERAREIQPSDPIVHMKLSQVLRQLGEEAQADTSLAEMQRLRDLKLKFSELHQKVLGDVSNADLRFQLGELAIDLGRPDLARVWFEAALALAPTHMRARAALQRVNEAPNQPGTGALP